MHDLRAPTLDFPARQFRSFSGPFSLCGLRLMLLVLLHDIAETVALVPLRYVLDMFVEFDQDCPPPASQQ